MASNIGLTEMTLDEYLEQEKQFLKDERKRIQDLYIQRAVDLFMKPPYSSTPDEARKLANVLVLNGEVPSSCGGSSSSDEDHELVGPANDLLQEYTSRSEFSVTLLPIQLPVKKSNKTIEDDTERRECQYKA